MAGTTSLLNSEHNFRYPAHMIPLHSSNRDLPSATAQAQLREIGAIIERHLAGKPPGDSGFTESGPVHPQLPLALYRRDSPTGFTCATYQPSFAFIAQGAKEICLGKEMLRYGSGQYLLTSIDVPVQTQIVEASPASPYQCFVMSVDMHEVATLVSEGAVPSHPATEAPGMSVSDVSAEVLDASLRLMRLLDRPHDIAALAPLIRRELTYRLLTGPHGARLRDMAVTRSKSHQIGQVIAWIRQNFTQPLRIGALAAMANMSTSSLHHHFKAITAMTPVQYQKVLRLQEARRLMLVDLVDAGTAGYRVGYESESQFSREYSRQFGRAPLRDVSTMRAALLSGGVAA
jgi:AraC-like DNA-binding protein